MNQKILIVDDEKGVVDMLKSYFEMQSFQVYTALNGKDALKQAAHNPDLVLLDINMPDMDGLAVCEKIRSYISCPILFLTARIEAADKIKGFQVGADDYIVKPFSNIELLMRVRAILRRNTAPAVAKQKNQLSFQDVILDLDSQSAVKGTETIALTYTEFKILELLASNKKKIYSLEHIYTSIWDDNAVGDSAIMVHIKNIRKKLGDNSREPKYIKTAWGRGYYID